MSAWDQYKKTMQRELTLTEAAKANEVSELARLLEGGADIEERDTRGYSPLMLAAYHGNVEAFDFLLQRGADPDGVDLAGNSVLMGAAFKGHLYMVQTLLARGADRLRQNLAGLDALGFANMFGRAEVARLLERT